MIWGDCTLVTTGLTGTPAETPVENMAEIMQTVMGKNPESWSDKAGGVVGEAGVENGHIDCNQDSREEGGTI